MPFAFCLRDTDGCRVAAGRRKGGGQGSPQNIPVDPEVWTGTHVPHPPIRRAGQADPPHLANNLEALKLSGETARTPALPGSARGRPRWERGPPTSGEPERLGEQAWAGRTDALKTATQCHPSLRMAPSRKSPTRTPLCSVPSTPSLLPQIPTRRPRMRGGRETGVPGGGNGRPGPN